MKIYVVRHCETDSNSRGILQGCIDTPLNETGKRQALSVFEQLKDIHFTLCFTSPLQRACETISIINNGKAEVIKDNRIIERNLGDFEGKSYENYDSNKYWDLDLNSGDCGVEPIKDLFKRVDSFYQELKEKYSNQTILIVSHGATIRALHYIITGYQSNDDLLSFKVNNGQVLEYEI